MGKSMDAHKTPIASSESPSAGLRRRQLWQVPVFLLGVAALVLTWVNRPCTGDCTARQLVRELNVARHELVHNNAEAALTMVRRVLEQLDRVPERQGEAYFLLGSAELALAGPGDPRQAAARYLEARKHLEQAEQAGVAEADQAPLRYRLAKADFCSAGDPRQVIDRLLAAVDQLTEDRDRGDAYVLLAQAYLRLPQPDLKGALAANERLRQLPLLPAEVLERAKLLGGELKLQLGRPEEARRDLSNIINNRAPQAVRARKQVLLARTYEEERRWADAAGYWEDVWVNDPPEAPAERGLVLYHLGLCHRQLDHKDAAIRYWEQCCALGQTAEGSKASVVAEPSQAAALALADLNVQDNKHDKALERLAFAARAVAKAEDWRNTLVSLDHVRKLFERACQAFRQAGHFDLAAQLIEHYQRLAAAGRWQALEAEVKEEWGRACYTNARALPDPGNREQEEHKAQQLLAEAGAAHAQLALLPLPPADQANANWQAIACYHEAGKNDKVIDLLLGCFLKQIDTNTDPRTGEAYYLLGETYRQEKKTAEANAAYEQCIAYQSPSAYRAHYQLAMANLEEGKVDRAIEILEGCISQMHLGGSGDALPEVYFTLGNLKFQRRDYRMVVRRLEPVLGNFPTGPETTRARYQLAESYRQLAAEENQKYLAGEYKDPETCAHFWKQYRLWLAKAADEYYELAQLLKQLGPDEARRHLQPEELLQVPFVAAECRFNLGKYEEALQLYEYLAQLYDRSEKRPERLQALGGTVRCHAALAALAREKKHFNEADKQQGDVQQRLTDIRNLLNSMDGPIRQQWEAWVTTASKPVVPNP
jgi:tetratricopeptide (TPR) repeat protein